jgi:hypothetical protein
MEKNIKLRKLCKDNKIFLWQIAEKISMQDTNFSKLLRHDLKENINERVFKALYELIEAKELEEAYE